MKRAGILIVASIAAFAQTPAGDPPPTPSAVEEAGLRQLRMVRRVYVDRLTGGETAAQIHDILVAALDGAKLFIVTENQEHADTIMRGAAEDLVYNEVHSDSDGINAHTNFGARNAGRYGGSASGGLGIGDNESDHSSERRHEAIAAVRLVNKDGDVIWSTTQESQGAKFHGASADVADKITAKLKEDYERARKLR